MENKYFTPDIEDIRVGYECELLINEDWERATLSDIERLGLQFTGIQNRYEWTFTELKDYIRVPYLTKEQIEADDYPIIGIYAGEGSLHKKGLYELVFLPNYRLVITKVWKSFEGEPDEKTHRKDVYNGPCQDINMFRYITKLLGV